MRPLIIFDLNGVFLDRERGESNSKPDFVIGKFKCYKRPGTKQFLKWVHHHFDVAVWSSAMPHNVIPIIENIWGKKMKELKFIFSQEQCTLDGMIDKKPKFLKDLCRVWKIFPWYDETNTLLVDDSPYKVTCNPPHTSIHPDPLDHDSLEKIIKPYLEKLLHSGMCVQEFVSKHALS